ncbi:MAG: hypothetical protein FJY98_03835 [Candidatus Liptonbacteria bacterium]|nr:hypothetical protein [Candidatus Liptonbacteria bacterium]
MWQTNKEKQLLRAMVALRNEAEAARFLRDLMTQSEIEEFANRLQAAEMLSDGRSYTDVQKATGLSSTTIARVSKWLQGGEGGYRAILNQLHHGSPISQVRRGLP